MSQLVTYSLQPIFNERGLLALPGSACILLKYDFGRLFCTTTVRGTYAADDDEGIGIARMTDHTPLLYDDVFWHELL